MKLFTPRWRWTAATIALLAIAAAPPVALAITVNTSGVAWPTTADVATSTTTTPFGFTDRANSAPFTLTQTFQVDSAFDAESLFVIYGGDAAAEFSVGLTVFEVEDVFAPMIATTPDPVDILLDTTFFAPPEPDETVMQVFLDAPLTLPATTGNAGYAVRFTNDDQFRWERSGSSGGNPYAFGTAYENGVSKNEGERDFALALSTEGLPELVDVFAVQSGNLNTASTWSDNAAPSAGNRYLIGDSFTVTANATTFNGGQVVVQSGGTLDLAVSDAVIDGDAVPGLVVEAGGLLTESVNGDVAVGSINLFPALSRLQLDGTANFTASPGADLFVDVDLSGSGELNFESNGSGSDMFLSAAEGHLGVIRFNGTGDAVRLTEQEGFGTLEMNSTGANQVVYEGADSAGGTAVIFNQPGELVHSSTLDRLQTTGQLVANAEVAVDLSSTFSGNERRMFFGGGLDGAANINVIGTPTDPTSGSTTRNEFELGGSAEPADAIEVDAYAGTLTGNDYVDFEVRRSQPNAAIVVNNNATLEMGHEEIFTEFSVALGEVQIASGGTLVVGYERDGFHNPYLLTMTGEGARDGDLTLESGSRTVMQVNGTNLEDYDRVAADGDVSIGGTLEILVNPEGFQSGFEQSNDIFINTYTPTLGDSFDLITLTSGSVSGDANGDGTVDLLDLDILGSNFGTTGATIAEGDFNGDGAVDLLDLDILGSNFGESGAVGGTLSGTFSSLVVTDPNGVMAAAGLAFQLNYTDSTVQLEVISAAAPAVPEPTAVLLTSLACLSISARCPRGRRSELVNGS